MTIKRKGLSRLGCEAVPFDLESFEMFLCPDAARELYDKALKELRGKTQSVKPEELRMLVGVRPDLFFCLTFVILGPFPLDEKRAREFGCINLQYPKCTMPTRQHTSAGQWAAAPREIPPEHWKFLDIS